MTSAPSRQKEDACRTAGPDRPRWVNSTDSSKAAPSAAARAGTEVPESAAKRLSEKVSGTSAGRVCVTAWPNRCAMSWASPVAPMAGIDLPPVATTRLRAVTGVRTPSRSSTAVKRSPSWPRSASDVRSHSSAPAASISARSIAMICADLPSQKSWPSVFSCQPMPCRATRSMKSHCV